METQLTRTLVLLRHAKSAWPEDVPDHDRPLAPRGRRDAPMVGRWLRQTGIVPDHVVCSTARRARETWQLAAAELGAQPAVVLESAVYGASAGGLLDLVRQLPQAVRTALLVGHDPGLSDLAMMLAGRSAEIDSQQTTGSALDRMRAKFPTAALAVLDLSKRWPQLDSGGARLSSFVTPREMRALRDSQQD